MNQCESLSAMIETSKGQVREMTDSGSSQVLIGRICEPKDCWAKLLF